jgi:hypothetical protein
VPGRAQRRIMSIVKSGNITAMLSENIIVVEDKINSISLKKYRRLKMDNKIAKIIEERENLNNPFQDKHFLEKCRLAGISPTVGLYGGDDDDDDESYYACPQCRAAGHYLSGHFNCFLSK